eukprot:scaffold58845_cov18-Prasinocladus_malaysianus.AAC.1
MAAFPRFCEAAKVPFLSDSFSEELCRPAAGCESSDWRLSNQLFVVTAKPPLVGVRPFQLTAATSLAAGTSLPQPAASCNHSAVYAIVVVESVVIDNDIEIHSFSRQ